MTERNYYMYSNALTKKLLDLVKMVHSKGLAQLPNYNSLGGWTSGHYVSYRWA